MRIIDSHHHLWKYNREDYGWMDDSMELLRRDYLPTELEPQLEKADVAGTIVVQARQKLEETRWLLDQAEKYDFIKGVVGWVDLCSEEVKIQLEHFAAHPKLVGVRHVIHDEADLDFMLREDFINGLEQLEAYGLTFDLLLFPEHLPNATKLARLLPRQSFVIDHLAKPCIKENLMEPWENHMRTIAELPNVWCKISGMVTEANLAKWKYEEFLPYLELVKSAFGSERLMIGSDWPVCRLAAEYDQVMAIPEKFFSSLNEKEKQAVFMNNALQLYGLA